MSSIEFSLLTDNTSKDFERFFEIYRTSINEREQKPKAEISKMPTRSDYRVLLMRQSGEIIGFSIVFLCPEFQFGLLEYMAVDEKLRNGGYGGLLLKHTFTSLNDMKAIQFGLIEVDSPHQESHDQVMRQRRYNFYSRHGCLPIAELNYILPLPGVGAPPEMYLMVFPVSELKPVAKGTLNNWLTGIYQKVYSCPPQDPRIGQMMKTISDPIQFQKQKSA